MESLDQLSTPPTPDERNIALLAHIGTLIGGFIVPLVVWLVKKDESEYVSMHAKESLNWQISVIIYVVISMILTLVVIGVFMVIAVSIMSLVFTILATIAASGGKEYKYPMCIRLIS